MPVFILAVLRVRKTFNKSARHYQLNFRSQGFNVYCRCTKIETRAITFSIAISFIRSRQDVLLNFLKYIYIYFLSFQIEFITLFSISIVKILYTKVLDKLALWYKLRVQSLRICEHDFMHQFLAHNWKQLLEVTDAV